MKALCWHGKHDIRCDEVPDPKIEHPRDAIVKVTSCAICGSDLHLYDGFRVHGRALRCRLRADAGQAAARLLRDLPGVRVRGLALVSRACGFSILKLVRYLREELLICLATTSSEVVLPRLLAKMERLGCDRSVVGLVVPTGYSFNLDGTCLYLAFAAVFLAQATDTPLTVPHQIGLLLVLLLTSKGAAGVFGAAFVVLAATLSSVGSIPVASAALVLRVHRLMAEGPVPVNYVGSAVATVVVATWTGALDRARLQRELDASPGRD